MSHQVDLPAKFSPLDGQAFVVDKQHTAFHHYLKVVAGHYKLGRFKSSSARRSFHVLATNQVMPYEEDAIPEAKFMYDVSPMAVVVDRQGRAFYDYITSLLAILGGCFTVVNLLDNTLYAIFKPKAD